MRISQIIRDAVSTVAAAVNAAATVTPASEAVVASTVTPVVASTSTTAVPAVRSWTGRGRPSASDFLPGETYLGAFSRLGGRVYRTFLPQVSLERLVSGFYDRQLVEDVRDGRCACRGVLALRADGQWVCAVNGAPTADGLRDVWRRTHTPGSGYVAVFLDLRGCGGRRYPERFRRAW